ncbi:MAG: hypothetical protein V7K21_19620 [Nostoc sp.]|uniref:hypothetical protein n=1 Tax=Nostoc sp. TaxID=1180 RepID=UPI002FF575CB
MPRLTVPPNFIGTSSIDTLVAEESNASVAIGIDILNLGEISTFSGNDSITGTATGTATFSKFSKAGTGIGIQNIKKTIITTGENTDRITGSANSLEANTLGYGIFNDGIIDTGNGHFYIYLKI